MPNKIFRNFNYFPSPNAHLTKHLSVRPSVPLSSGSVSQQRTLPTVHSIGFRLDTCRVLAEICENPNPKPKLKPKPSLWARLTECEPWTLNVFALMLMDLEWGRVFHLVDATGKHPKHTFSFSFCWKCMQFAQINICLGGNLQRLKYMLLAAVGSLEIVWEMYVILVFKDVIYPKDI